MGTLILKGARLIDGTGAPPVEGGVVVVEGKRIQQVGAAGQVRLPEDARTIDLPGCTLMPGLMDVHIHIAMFEVSDFPTRDAEKAARFEYTPEARLLYVAKRLRRMVESGFTTIRDVGGAPTATMVALRDAIEEGTIPGPRLVVAGLTVGTNAHLAHLASYTAKRRETRVAANGPWALRELAREHFAAGADYLKTELTGGVGTAKEAIKRWTLSREELEAIVDEGHALGRLVACHCHWPDAIRVAVAAGVDTVEHCVYTDDDAIDLLVRERKILVPTLTHRRSEGIQAHIRAGSHPTILQKMKMVEEICYDSFRKLYRAGVKLACGTDAGFEPAAGNSAIELGIYVRLGMSPMEAIVTATRNAAEAIGRAGDLGTLEPGKLADVIAVDGNPLEDIRLLQEKENVKLVVKDGGIGVDRWKV